MLIYTCCSMSSGRTYIGKTIRTLKVRMYEHLKELRNGTKGGEWQEDFIKYGENDFVFEELETAKNYQELSTRETELIHTLGTLSPNGYNKTTSSGPEYSTDRLIDKSKHTVETLNSIMLLAVSSEPYFSVSDISKKCNVTEHTVQDLLRLKSYTWLKESSNEIYTLIENIHNSGMARSTYLKYASLIDALRLYVTSNLTDAEIADICNITKNSLRDLVRGKAYTALASLNIREYIEATKLYSTRNINRTKEKSILDTETNTKYTFNTAAEGARLISIDGRRVSDLISGRMKKYKHYILV